MTLQIKIGINVHEEKQKRKVRCTKKQEMGKKGLHILLLGY